MKFIAISKIVKLRNPSQEVVLYNFNLPVSYIQSLYLVRKNPPPSKSEAFQMTGGSTRPSPSLPYSKRKKIYYNLP